MKTVFPLAALGFILFGFGAVVPSAERDGLGGEEMGKGMVVKQVEAGARMSGLERRAEDEEMDASVSATVVVGEKTAVSTFTSTLTFSRTTESTFTPTPTPFDDQLDDDLDDFLSLDDYSRLARDQETPYPYEQVFANENATAIHQPIQTERLDVYDATSCAELCNTHGACISFGIFIERQPSCTDCSTPQSEEASMCALYNTTLDRDEVGQGGSVESIQGRVFTRAVRASNGYNRLGQTTTVYAATTTQTVRASAAASVTATVYSTRTVTETTDRAVAFTITDTVYLAGTARTVTRTASGAVPTRTVTVYDPAPYYTATVTITDSSPRPTLTVISISTATSTLTQTLIIDAPPRQTTLTTTLTSTSTATIPAYTRSITATVTQTAYAIVSASPTVSVSTRTKTETEIETDTETETVTYTLTPVDPIETQYWRV
ncbi:hypothetical protein N0V94_009643 [Neodidymelliopsis sp. IMI 364377]|nr:hypothetical protein N0V94_009643 [Neodidymelliopsis sp. IMI 364377]